MKNTFYIKIVPIIAILNFSLSNIILYSYKWAKFYEFDNAAIRIIVGGVLCVSVINFTIALLMKKKYANHFSILGYLIFAFALPFAFPYFLKSLVFKLRDFLDWRFHEFL